MRKYEGMLVWSDRNLVIRANNYKLQANPDTVTHSLPMPLPTMQPRQLRCSYHIWTHGWPHFCSTKRAALLTATPPPWPPSFETWSIWDLHEALVDCFLGHGSSLHPKLPGMGLIPSAGRAQMTHRPEGTGVGGRESPRILTHWMFYCRLPVLGA